MEPVQPFDSSKDMEPEEDDRSMQEMDVQEMENWEPFKHGTNRKQLVQITLYGAHATLLPAKVKVRSHLRHKKEIPKKKRTPTLTPKKIGRAPTMRSRKTKSSKSLKLVIPVKDPDLEETVKLLQKMKFNNSMELRDRFFS
jgi:hypothetical protein